MNEWLLRGAPADLQRHCLEVASAYKRSLDRLLAALAELPQTVEVKLAIERASDFRALIEDDLSMLDSRSSRNSDALTNPRSK